MSSPTTMQAIQVHDYGTPDVLRLENIPIPQAKPNEVLVRIKAAAVNPVDWKIRAGYLREVMPQQMPYIPGSDFCGTVEAVGAAVRDFSIGDDIFGEVPVGAYAEFVAAPADLIAKKPQSLDYLEAASVPMVSMTAWQALFDAGQLQAGQTVLIHGAAGGVGMFAVQLARWKGARVIATASGDSVAVVRQLGADAVIDYKVKPFDQAVRDADLVLDTIGGETQKRSFAVLKRGGRLVNLTGEADKKLAGERGVEAITMFMKPSGKLLAQIGEHLDSGVLETSVERTFTLAEAQQAQELSATGHVHGKIVIEVQE